MPRVTYRASPRPLILLGTGALVASAGILTAQQVGLPKMWRSRLRSNRGRRKLTAFKEAFRGVTATGTVESDLYPVRSTGVSTEPVRRAALAFRASLTPAQRAKSVYAIDDDEWRK
jgi:hypothetical protein